MTALLLALLLASPPTAPTTAPAPATRAAEPMAFDKFHFVVLTAPETPPADLTREQAAALMPQHLEHLGEMARAGHLLVAGPFSGRYDERMRGLCLYRGELSRERVLELAGADPAVRAGLLEVRVMDWYTEAGALTFPIAERMAGTAVEP